MKFKTGLTIAALTAAGYGAWAMYKKYNPNAKQELMTAMRNITNQAERNIENMM